MSNQVALKFQSSFYNFSVSLNNMMIESADIEKLYFSGASTQLAALTDPDPATTATKLTKLEISNGIGFCQQLNKFFNNVAVTTGDYLAVIEPILYGNDPKSTPLSVEVEAIGNRLYLLCQDALTNFNTAKNLYTTYWSNEIGNAVGALTSSTVFYGIDATVGDLINAITLSEQYKKLINNEAVATSDYKSIIAKWQRLS